MGAEIVCFLARATREHRHPAIYFGVYFSLM
jgi:hypothetical protein